MSSANPGPYLIVQRMFPSEDVGRLATQIDHAYIDIASKVNARTIGIYQTMPPIYTGDQWYLKGGNQKQQTIRQLFTFTATGNIPHGIIWSEVSLISPNSYGTFTDGTNWYGVIYASNIAIPGQVSFYVTPTNIVVLSGSGSPAIVNGTIILEWLSQP